MFLTAKTEKYINKLGIPNFMSQKGSEDYLRIILELSEDKEVRSIDIAKNLKISKPSVSEMIKKLKKLNLIEFQPYSKITLTGKGKKMAEKISEKHRIIEKFAEKLGHEKPHDEAHKLEHHFSDKFADKIRELIEGKRRIESIPSYIS